jgi:Xaa-Pro dipeptidase
MLSRRLFLGSAAAAPAALAVAQHVKAAESALASITGDAKPITAEERKARLGKLQDLMGRQKIGAMLIESGSSLDYFTGIQWWRSERTTAAVIPAKGEIVIVTPAFEEPSIRETLQVGGEVRVWQEHENPFELLAGALKDRGASVVAVEPTTRFFIIDHLRKASPTLEIVSGDALVRACRMHKSPAELALMRIANKVTIEAIRHAHANVKAGMTQGDIAGLIGKATLALGAESEEFSLVLLNEASAYPHGSKVPQTVREGSVVLVDCGCTVRGYQSDISRSWVFGEPSAKQRKLWQTVKRGQEVALENAKLGAPCGSIDDAVRRY